MGDVSKFGGVPVDGDGPRSKFGGVAVDSGTAAPESPQQLTHPPTVMDRISNEVNQGGKALDPEAIVHGLGESLSRSAQAYSNLRSGQGSGFGDVVDSVPLVGPMLHDAYTKITTPGQRVEGLTDFGMMALPLSDGAMASRTPLSLAEGDIPVSGRVASALKTAAPDVGKGTATAVGSGMLGYVLPHEAMVGLGFPMVKGLRQVASGVSKGVNEFRGPVLGPELAPKGFQSPYPTLPYERPYPAASFKSWAEHGVPFKPELRPDWQPPVFDQSPPVGQPGAVLPSGSVVGPAPPSRVNPPLPRGNAPRVPVWQGVPITGEPLPGRDLSPIYPPSPILESGRVIGPRPSLMTEPSRGTVINGSPQSTAKPAISQPDLDALNQQLRDSLKARGVVSDTPASVRTRANASRAKFDENGKRNQLKSK